MNIGIPGPTHYVKLGVPSTATAEEIKKAYQQLVLKVHPDKVNPSLSAEEQQQSLDDFHAITQAWQVLGNKEQRELYDKGVREQSLLQEWPVNAHVDLDDMEFYEGSFTWNCRCSGHYVITEQDLEKGRNVVCCSMCTLCIRVMYSVISDREESDHEEPRMA